MKVDESRILEDEREIQYFGFSSSEFVQDFSEIVVNTIQSTFLELQQTLIERLGEDERGRVESDTKKLQSLYFDNFAIVVEKFAEKARSVLAIPPNLKISDLDDGDEREVSLEELESIKKEVEALENEYFQERYFLELLKKQKASYDLCKPVVYNVDLTLKKTRQCRPTPGKKGLKEMYEALETLREFYDKDDSADETTKKQNLLKLFQ